MKITDTHIYFYGSFLSQWFPSKFVYHNIVFNCAEQFMMFKKAVLFNDFESMEKILLAEHPREQKKIGRQIKNFDESLWLQHRFEIVKQGNLLKFGNNPELMKLLFGTEDKILVEASPYDRIWGIGLSEDDPLILQEENWRGSNLLGKCLMQVRHELRLFERMIKC